MSNPKLAYSKSKPISVHNCFCSQTVDLKVTISSPYTVLNTLPMLNTSNSLSLSRTQLGSAFKSDSIHWNDLIELAVGLIQVALCYHLPLSFLTDLAKWPTPM